MCGSFTRRFLPFFAIPVWAFSAFARPNFNIDSLSFRGIDNTRGCWGYVAPNDSEYALICGHTRLLIWNVTSADAPKFVRSVPTAGAGAFADLKQVRPYKNYIIAVNQNGGTNRAALQVIDMSNPAQARTVTVWPDTFAANNTLPHGAHTIHIEGDSAYLGMNGAANEWYVIDISDPLRPTFKSKYMTSAPVCGNFGAQSHDSYVKNDTGYIAFLGAGFSIVAKRPDKPVGDFQKIADVCYPGAVTHNCWPTEDRKHLFTTDETVGGHLRVWDIRSPTNPVQVGEWMPPGRPTIVHNVQVKGSYAYLSYYADGAVILDIEDPTQPVEVGHYDTSPNDSSTGFSGCWDFFPYFSSGALVASNYSSPAGMWLLRFNGTKAGKLRGAVVNWETGAPVPDATVRFLDVPRRTKTDFSGNYLIRTEGGPVRLEFSHPDFRPETLLVNAVFNDTVEVDAVPLVPISLLPTTPQSLTAKPIDGGDIILSWQTPPDDDLVAFHIYRTLPGDTTTFSLLASVTPPETSYIDVGTVAGERFFYRITAENPLFEGFPSAPVKAMRFVLGPKLLLVNRTGPALTSDYAYFRDSIESFYRRALRRFDFDTLSLKDEATPLPAGIPPGFVARNRYIYVHSAELRPNSIPKDNPTFLSYFIDYFKAGGKLLMDGHWPLGGIMADESYLKCTADEAPFPADPALWDSIQGTFGFDCIFFPRIFPFDTGLVNRSFLNGRPQKPGYPLLTADSGRSALGIRAFLSPGVNYAHPTVPAAGYFTSRDTLEDLYRFGSVDPASDPKEGLTVAKKHLNPSTGGGFVWFNFPLFYMQEESAKKTIRRALADLGLPEDFPKGDLNQDRASNEVDAVYLTNYIFLGIPFPAFDSDEADFNCDGSNSAADLVLFLLNIFPPNSPFTCD